MTDDVKTELAAIRERYEAATEGPWRADGLEGNLHSPRSRVAEVYMWLEDDAHFIAHARTDVPRLVAALEAVLCQIDRADPPGAMKAGTPTVSTAVLRGSITAALTTTTKEARLTARDHCDGGCINPGSGDCPTCKAAASEGPTDG